MSTILPVTPPSPEQLVRVPCLGQGQSLRNERLDLVRVKKIEERDQRDGAEALPTAGTARHQSPAA
jgi:hypothetical protein